MAVQRYYNSNPEATGAILRFEIPGWHREGYEGMSITCLTVIVSGCRHRRSVLLTLCHIHPETSGDRITLMCQWPGNCTRDLKRAQSLNTKVLALVRSSSKQSSNPVSDILGSHSDFRKWRKALIDGIHHSFLDPKIQLVHKPRYSISKSKAAPYRVSGYKFDTSLRICIYSSLTLMQHRLKSQKKIGTFKPRILDHLSMSRFNQSWLMLRKCTGPTCTLQCTSPCR